MQAWREMREADRGPMGHVAHGAIAAILDRFFAEPVHSVQGWQTAADAQRRIVKSVDQALDEYPHQDVLFAGHGTVGHYSTVTGRDTRSAVNTVSLKKAAISSVLSRGAENWNFAGLRSRTCQ